MSKSAIEILYTPALTNISAIDAPIQPAQINNTRFLISKSFILPRCDISY